MNEYRGKLRDHAKLFSSVTESSLRENHEEETSRLKKSLDVLDSITSSPESFNKYFSDLLRRTNEKVKKLNSSSNGELEKELERMQSSVVDQQTFMEFERKVRSSSIELSNYYNLKSLAKKTEYELSGGDSEYMQNRLKKEKEYAKRRLERHLQNGNNIEQYLKTIKNQSKLLQESISHGFCLYIRKTHSVLFQNGIYQMDFSRLHPSFVNR